MKILTLLFLLIPLAAGAAENDDPALSMVRAAISLQQVANTLQATVAGLQKAGPIAPTMTPVSAPVAAPVADPPSPVLSEVRDGLVSFAAVLLPALTGLGLAWMRGHLKIMQDVGMNASITQSANGFAGLLVQAIQQRGGSLSALSAHSPEVAPLATSLINSYPQFTGALGMGPEKAGFLILKEAAKIVSAIPDVGQPVEPQAVVPAPPATNMDTHQEIVQTPVAAAAMVHPKDVAPSWSTSTT